MLKGKLANRELDTAIREVIDPSDDQGVTFLQDLEFNIHLEVQAE